MSADNPLPLELAPGVHWLGECYGVTYQGDRLHGCNSVYLVSGEDSSLLVECGPPMHLAEIETQLDEILATGLPSPRYIFPTHPETNHAGGLGRMLARFPELRVVGDPTDLGQYLPDYVDRVEELRIGEAIDLGGRRFFAQPAVIRDHRTTRWGFDDGSHILFTGDGLAYTHHHMAGQCGRTAEEAGPLEIADMTTLFSEAALYWTRYVDIEPYIARLDDLIAELDVHIIAPTHGLPVADLEATLPEVRRGLRSGSQTSRETVR